MTAFVALLRAVNLGAHQKIAMADLRAFATALGLANVRTIVQSGNLVFESGKTAAAVETLLENAAAEELGLNTPILVRGAAQWDALIAGNPFPREAKSMPNHLVVMPLKAAATAANVAALRAKHQGPEQIEARGALLYMTYPDGIGESKLTIKKIESALGTVGTARNWNTALKIAAMLGA